MRDLRRVRQYLTDEAAILVANALVSSRPDYCNSLFRSLSSFNMRNLQCIQTHLVGLSQIAIDTHRLLLFSKKLHWLPVEFRCIFKTATLVYKFLHNGHPSYFSPHLSIHYGRYGTTYNNPDKSFQEVPQYYPSVHKSKKHFIHSFAYYAPKLWNDLPDDVCFAPNLACFRKKLKSYLLDKAFPP